MDDVDLSHLLNQEEGEKFDIKRQLNIGDEDQKSKFIKDIISMANTPGDQPAFIVIGVGTGIDGHTRYYDGVTAHPDDATLQEIVKDKVAPVPRFSYRAVSYAGRSFGLIQIYSGDRLHQTTIKNKYGVLEKNTIYIRRGSSNQPADASDIERVVHEKWKSMFDRVLKEQAWARGTTVNVARAPGPWTPRSTFSGTSIESANGNVGISPGDWVVVTFQQRPSERWSDPPVASILGSFDVENQQMTRRRKRLVIRLQDGAEIVTDHRPLCIPSYDVDVEWRDESYLADPVWGEAKAVVVRRFLEKCRSQKMLCRVVYVGVTERGATFHLNSPDYDEYLKDHWLRVKGVENALAKSKLFKRSLISEASEEQLRIIVQNDLLARGVILHMLPPRFRDAWSGESPDAELVFLVLRGLINRYERLRQRRANSTAAP